MPIIYVVLHSNSSALTIDFRLIKFYYREATLTGQRYVTSIPCSSRIFVSEDETISELHLFAPSITDY